MSRRGPYQKYLRCQDKSYAAKIPKQTKWNRKKKVCRYSVFLLLIQIAMVKNEKSFCVSQSIIS